MRIDWDKVNGLLPVIVQDDSTSQVLMLGYMNAEALKVTIQTQNITFFSRTKKRLWTKGEISGNTLALQSMSLDCDGDTLLCKALPNGPTCHTGDITCFHDDTSNPITFLQKLAQLIHTRAILRPKDSYTTSLLESGTARIAQKVGEEGVELAIACMKDDKTEILNECADLFFHALVSLENADLKLEDVCKILKVRHNA
jgi:phosphoribosyl-ATP pyrophosphohydrolase/phosphoribosyl-AMP cyclohydrolase